MAPHRHFFKRRGKPVLKNRILLKSAVLDTKPIFGTAWKLHHLEEFTHQSIYPNQMQEIASFASSGWTEQLQAQLAYTLDFNHQ